MTSTTALSLRISAGLTGHLDRFSGIPAEVSGEKVESVQAKA